MGYSTDAFNGLNKIAQAIDKLVVVELIKCGLSHGASPQEMKEIFENTLKLVQEQ